MTGSADLRSLIDGGETLTVEFKSDRRRLPDRDIVEAAACLANGPGGTLLLGVEDDGQPTGAVARHGRTTDPARLQATIANLTVPPLSTEIHVVDIDEHEIIVVKVPSSAVPIGTNSGVYTRRALQTDGRPQCVPYPFHEMYARRASVGEADYATLHVAGATWDDLDPLEFERFRTLARAGGGDLGLAGLADAEIARALGVLAVDTEERTPLVGALLLFGRTHALTRHVPTHDVLFQVLRGTSVEANEPVREPLFKVAERLYDRVTAYNRDEEIEAGLLRLTIPLIPREAVREVVANALVHRDYTKLGAVVVQLTEEALTVTSPGGFPEGIRFDNYLRESRPRSPILAEAFKRAGLVERTGRGINRMFEATLRIGREAPDFQRSSDTSVIAVFALGAADVQLARYVLEQERATGRPFNLGDLQVLHRLRAGGRLSVADAAAMMQKSEPETRQALTRMVAAGLVEERGSGRGRTYHLSSSVYRAIESRAAYVRVRQFEPIQHEQMIVTFVRAHGRITRAEAADLCGLAPEQASVLLRKLAKAGSLRMVGERRGAYYVTGP